MALPPNTDIWNWATTASPSELSNPANYAGMSASDFQNITSALTGGVRGGGGGDEGGSYGSSDANLGLLKQAQSAMQQGNPDTWNYLQAAGNKGSFWTGLRDSAQGTAANTVLPFATLGLSTAFNKDWSKGAQEGIDPTLQGFSALTGAGVGAAALYGAGAGAGAAGSGVAATPTAGATVGTGTEVTNAALLTDPALTGEAGGGAMWAPATSGSAFDVGAVGTGAGIAGAGSTPLWMQLANLGMGVYGLSQAGKFGGGTAADPFAPYRGQAAQQLMDLQKNPALVTQQPGYQAGLDAVERKMASEGFQGSGNMMAELSNYGTNAYDKAVQQLMTMSGATSSPATGAAVNQQGQIAGTQLAGQSLNTILTTIAQMAAPRPQPAF